MTKQIFVIFQEVRGIKHICGVELTMSSALDARDVATRVKQHNSDNPYFKDTCYPHIETFNENQPEYNMYYAHRKFLIGED